MVMPLLILVFVVVACVVAVVVVAVNDFTTTTTATTTTPTTIAGFSTLSCAHRTGPPCPGLHGLVPHGPRELHRSTQDGVGGTMQHSSSGAHMHVCRQALVMVAGAYSPTPIWPKRAHDIQ